MVTFDFSSVTGDITKFPEGAYEATVVKAEESVSTSGNPQIVVDLEVSHPVYGLARLRDWITPAFASKSYAFYQAFSRFSDEEMRSLGKDVDIAAVDLVGASIIVCLGKSSYERDNKQTGKREQVDTMSTVQPFFFPDTRVDMLDPEFYGDMEPFSV